MLNIFCVFLNYMSSTLNRITLNIVAKLTEDYVKSTFVNGCKRTRKSFLRIIKLEVQITSRRALYVDSWFRCLGVVVDNYTRVVIVDNKSYKIREKERYIVEGLKRVISILNYTRMT